MFRGRGARGILTTATQGSRAQTKSPGAGLCPGTVHQSSGAGTLLAPRCGGFSATPRGAVSGGYPSLSRASKMGRRPLRSSTAGLGTERR